MKLESLGFQGEIKDPKGYGLWEHMKLPPSHQGNVFTFLGLTITEIQVCKQ